MDKPKLSMKLSTGGFDRFLKDGGGIDFRLNQESWSVLADGDIFEFIEDPGGERRYCVKIIKLYKAVSFEELIDNFPDELFDKSKKIAYLEFFAQWWSIEEEQRNGVLGIHVAVLN